MVQEASQSVREIREQTIGRVRAARSGVSALSNRIESIRADVDRSEVGRRKEVARVIEEARPAMETWGHGEARNPDAVVECERYGA